MEANTILQINPNKIQKHGSQLPTLINEQELEREEQESKICKVVVKICMVGFSGGFIELTRSFVHQWGSYWSIPVKNPKLAT